MYLVFKLLCLIQFVSANGSQQNGLGHEHASGSELENVQQTNFDAAAVDRAKLNFSLSLDTDPDHYHNYDHDYHYGHDHHHDHHYHDEDGKRENDKPEKTKNPQQQIALSSLNEIGVDPVRSSENNSTDLPRTTETTKSSKEETTKTSGEESPRTTKSSTDSLENTSFGTTKSSNISSEEATSGITKSSNNSSEEATSGITKFSTDSSEKTSFGTTKSSNNSSEEATSGTTKSSNDSSEEFTSGKTESPNDSSEKTSFGTTKFFNNSSEESTFGTTKDSSSSEESSTGPTIKTTSTSTTTSTTMTTTTTSTSTSSTRSTTSTSTSTSTTRSTTSTSSSTSTTRSTTTTSSSTSTTRSTTTTSTSTSTTRTTTTTSTSTSTTRSTTTSSTSTSSSSSTSTTRSTTTTSTSTSTTITTTTTSTSTSTTHSTTTTSTTSTSTRSTTTSSTSTSTSTTTSTSTSTTRSTTSTSTSTSTTRSTTTTSSSSSTSTTTTHPVFQCPGFASGFEKVSDNGLYYKLYNGSDVATYDQAKAICESFEGGYLAMFKTPQSYKDVKDFRQFVQDNMWIGLNNTNGIECTNDLCINQLFWTDNTLVTNVSYTDGINAEMAEQCLAMQLSGAVDDYDCGLSRPFLCQVECSCENNPCENNGTCINQPVGFECQCAPGYEGMTCKERDCPTQAAMDGFIQKRNELYYRFYSGDDAKTFFEAKAFCNDQRGYLAMFKTQEDFNIVLQEFRQNLSSTDMWIGIENNKRETCNDKNECLNQFFWIDEEMMTIPNYVPGAEANDSLPCIAMLKDGSIGDEACEVDRPFLCQLNCSDRFPEFILLQLGGFTGLSNPLRNTRTFQTIDVLGTNCTCEVDLFPMAIDGMVSTIINDRAIFCGGFVYNAGGVFDCDCEQRNCWELRDGSWFDLTEENGDIILNVQRNDGNSILYSENLWWVTGGTTTFQLSGDTRTTELFNVTDEKFYQFVDLPVDQRDHAIVRIDQNRIMMLPGERANNSPDDRCWFFFQDTQTWIEGPSQLIPTNRPLAGAVTYPNGLRAVIVVGGSTGLETQKYWPHNNSWTMGNSIPLGTNIYVEAEMLSFRESFYFVGGDGTTDGTTGQLDCIVTYDVSADDWVILDEKLNNPLEDVSAIMMRKDLLRCTPN